MSLTDRGLCLAIAHLEKTSFNSCSVTCEPRFATNRVEHGGLAAWFVFEADPGLVVDGFKNGGGIPAAAWSEARWWLKTGALKKQKPKDLQQPGKKKKGKHKKVSAQSKKSAKAKATLFLSTCCEIWCKKWQRLEKELANFSRSQDTLWVHAPVEPGSALDEPVDFE